MRLDCGDWSDHPASPAGQLREQRSGLTGFGARPALHPAWRVLRGTDAEPPDSQLFAAPSAAIARR